MTMWCLRPSMPRSLTGKLPGLEDALGEAIPRDDCLDRRKWVNIGFLRLNQRCTHRGI